MGNFKVAKSKSMVLGAALAAVFLFPGLASAERAEWSYKVERNTSVDGSDAGKSADFFAVTRIIEAKTDSSPIIFLSCQINSKQQFFMNVGVQLDPENTYESNPKRRLDMTRVSAKLWLSEKGKMERWQYHPASTRMIPFDRTVARKVFNAAVRGDTIRIKTAREDFSMKLPEQNAVFKDFAKWCPITNGGEIPRVHNRENSLPPIDNSGQTLP